jgi:hypothetical protein
MMDDNPKIPFRVVLLHIAHRYLLDFRHDDAKEVTRRGARMKGTRVSIA